MAQGLRRHAGDGVNTEHGRDPMSSRESTTQGESGRRGSEAEQNEGAGRQPPQGSQRVEQPRGSDERKHTFDPGRAPSEQGESEHPSPEVIARHQQGLAGRGRASGSQPDRNDRSEERATRGEPADDHTRHGRQTTPGDRRRK
jgi:hypothetical protein